MEKQLQQKGVPPVLHYAGRCTVSDTAVPGLKVEEHGTVLTPWQWPVDKCCHWIEPPHTLLFRRQVGTELGRAAVEMACLAA